MRNHTYKQNNVPKYEFLLIFAVSFSWSFINVLYIQGRIQGWGGTPAPPKIGENKIWRKIVIFHTKYSKNFRASLRAIILSAPPNLKSWIRPWYMLTAENDDTFTTMEQHIT